MQSTRRAAAAALVIAMVLILAAGCAPANAEYLGTWTATQAQILGADTDISQIFGSGFTLELKGDGTCKLTVDGLAITEKWKIEGDTITLSGDEFECTGQLNGNRMVLNNMMDLNLNVLLEK